MNRVIIERDNFLYNINQIKDYAKANNEVTPTIIAVLKANAYGVTYEIASKLLLENGIDFFAVTDVYEALKLKEFVNGNPILVLNSTCIDEEVRIIVENNFIASCGSFEAIELLEKISKEYSKRTKFHINIDTGMSRFGFRAKDLLKSSLDVAENDAKDAEFNRLTKMLTELENSSLEGIYTHFQQSYEKKVERTKEQFDLFINVINKLKENNIDVGIKHCSNTSAFFKYPYMHLDAVRIGSAFSGRSQSEISKRLKKVGYLESSICEVRNIKKGDKVFYSGMYTAPEDMKVAIVEAGYKDGIELSGPYDEFKAIHVLRRIKNLMLSLFRDRNIYVLINQKRSQILGRIGMRNFVCDISNIDAKIGDKVIIDIPLSITPSDVTREIK